MQQNPTLVKQIGQQGTTSVLINNPNQTSMLGAPGSSVKNIININQQPQTQQTQQIMSNQQSNLINNNNLQIQHQQIKLHLQSQIQQQQQQTQQIRPGLGQQFQQKYYNYYTTFLF